MFESSNMIRVLCVGLGYSKNNISRSQLLSMNYGSSVTKFKTSVANFVLFVLSLLIVGGSLCNMFLSQGGGRTTAMLPSLRPDLLSRPPCLPHCHRPAVNSLVVNCSKTAFLSTKIMGSQKMQRRGQKLHPELIK